MSEPVMSMYASKEECLQARADYFERQRNKLLEAIKEIQHSMYQASIPGNDKYREINLSLAICIQALADVEASK